MSLRIAVVGIGNMGWPMAACLLRAGHDVLVSDSRRETAEAFVREVGGTAPASLLDLAAAADVLITMLPTSAVVETVLGEALPALRSGALVIDMTSGIPSVTRRLAAAVAASGSAMIDAPVSGGVARAKTGTLAIMVGGEDADVLRARPVLEAMGSTITVCGGIGAGQAMKALNNLVSAGGFLIGVEALLIGQEFGLDPGLMTDVLNASTGMNNSTQKKFRQFVLSRNFDSGFGLDLMVKDLSIAMQIARDGDIPAPFASACRELWAAASSMLGAGQDHTAIAKLSERLAGRELQEHG
jgi:3-hydroxyisobutyrate dehydrogenase